MTKRAAASRPNIPMRGIQSSGRGGPPCMNVPIGMEAINGIVIANPMHPRTTASMMNATKRSQKPAYITVGAGAQPAAGAAGAEATGVVPMVEPGEATPVSWPHALQNVALSGTFAPHFEQYIAFLLLPGRLRKLGLWNRAHKSAPELGGNPT